MFSILTFFIGIIVLIRGRFSLFGRTINQPQSRTVALVLMAPLVIFFCLSAATAPNYFQVNADGSMTLNTEDLYAFANTLSIIELIAVLASIGYAVLTILSVPPTTIAAQQPMPATPIPTRVPDIMTVTEAAAYMRVGEDEVLNLINDGKLAAARIGGSYRIARIAIDDFMSGA